MGGSIPPLAHVPLLYLLILLSHLCLVLTIWLFLSHFLALNLYAFFSSPLYVLRVPLISSSITYHPKKQEYFQKIKISLSCSLCNFIHHPVTFLLPGTNIFLNTPSPNTVSLSSSLNGRSQVQHPSDTTTNWKVKETGPNRKEIFRISSGHNFFTQTITSISG